MKDRQYLGYLISFEGGEGSGKTSSLPRVLNDLKKLGLLNVVAFREPGGGEISDEIRRVLLKKREGGELMDNLTELFLFEASRRQAVVNRIIPNLLAGRVVFFDRFMDSSVVYQGYVRGLGCGRVDWFNNWITGGLEPDLTVLFDVDAEVGLSRRAEDGGVNRLDAENILFHERVNWAYRQLAEFNRAYSGGEPRWEVVNANLGQEEVLGNVFRIVEARLVMVGLLEGKRRGVEY